MIKTALVLIFLWGLGLNSNGDTCLDCHTNILNKPMQHEAAKMDCANCHDLEHKGAPGSNHLITSDISELCFNCHDKKALIEDCFPTYGRPACGHPASQHPVAGPKDPIYPLKAFTCVSCHNPHSSDMPKLFRYKYDKTTVYQGANCAVCHWRIYHESPMPSPPPWNP